MPEYYKAHEQLILAAGLGDIESHFNIRNCVDEYKKPLLTDKTEIMLQFIKGVDATNTVGCQRQSTLFVCDVLRRPCSFKGPTELKLEGTLNIECG